MSDRPKIEMQGVCKAFGSKKVLDGINLSVPVGSSMVIIGGSGTGKSVMLKCVLGLLTADKGSIKIDGQEMIGAGTREREEMIKKFGMLFQGGALFDSLPIWYNVAFGLIHGKHVNKKDARKTAIEKLEAVGMGEAIADLYPAELSGGMQKRVSLARAIATSPEIIFF
ncbi:MAG TPA: ATP-binding cassette domain-containing protein, partial [Alphaproteobacteria bacterium]|nr:ATP-binding cassette domain-containing protein [Alphaproteobacteria bacterium]